MFETFLQELAEARRREPAFCVATVVAVRGSSSAKPGAKAIISAEGINRWGWVGGGCAESFIIEQSLEVLAEHRSRVIEVDLDDELLGVGMPCGGYMDVYIEPVFPARHLALTGEDPVFGALALLAHHADYAVTVYRDGARPTDYPYAALASTRALANDTQALCLHGGEDDPATLAAGFQRPAARAVMLLAGLIAHERGKQAQPLSMSTKLQEKASGATPELLIVGHSRIAEELVRLGVLLGWPVTVNSPELRIQNFPSEAILITDDMDLSMNNLNPATHLIIASQHKGDHAAARNALRNGVGWLGLVASRKRSGLVLDFLLQAGIDENRLGAVRAPAGLDLGAVTPFDIALSIVAQIIQRNGANA